MKERLDKFMRRPAVAHVLAALNRYNKRLGPQFAAAVTYFSVLSIVPVLLFAVAMLGFTLTVLRPEWFDIVKSAIQTELKGSELAGTISDVVDHAFTNWQSITYVAVLTAAYAGSRWTGNLKKAFRVMWGERFSDAAVTKNFVLEILENLLIFLGLLLSVLVAVGITGAGSVFSQDIVRWLNLGSVPGIELLLRLVSILLTLVASWVLFAFLFFVLPRKSTTMRTWLIGTIAGAVLVTALQQVAGLIVGVFRGNAAITLFGNVIVLMLVFNVLATMILMVAAWVGTADTWEQDRLKQEADKAAGEVGGDEVDGVDDDVEDKRPEELEPSNWKVRDRQRRAARLAATHSLDDLRADNFDPEDPRHAQEGPPVSQEVAARSVRMGAGLGYGVGAATGIGIGALVASFVGWLTRRG